MTAVARPAPMQEGIRTFESLGLDWLIDRLPERVRVARLRCGTNDVVLVIFPNNESADIFSGTRQTLINDLVVADPPLPETLKHVLDARPVGEVWAVTYMREGVFLTPVSAPLGTTSALN